jgi:hypothetical protein
MINTFTPRTIESIASDPKVQCAVFVAATLGGPVKQVDGYTQEEMSRAQQLLRNDIPTYPAETKGITEGMVEQAFWMSYALCGQSPRSATAPAPTRHTPEQILANPVMRRMVLACATIDRRHHGGVPTCYMNCAHGFTRAEADFAYNTLYQHAATAVHTMGPTASKSVISRAFASAADHEVDKFKQQRRALTTELKREAKANNAPVQPVVVDLTVPTRPVRQLPSAITRHQPHRQKLAQKPKPLNRTEYIKPTSEPVSTPTTNVPEHELCVICRDARKNFIMLPCGHVCACHTCAEDLVQNQQNSKAPCPLCRTSVDKCQMAFV